MTPLLLPELLAPAGSLDCLRAAVCAGANAVYLGLEKFNARRNADNFTLDNLKDACDYAHLHGVSVYITLNVEVFQEEFAQAIEYAQEAWRKGADAFIVQDIGLAIELAHAIPEAPLHASTQMNIHNAAGIEAAAQLDMSRITLARELSVCEISELTKIARTYNIDIECFAHGALCICYSGLCLMSSMIGGRSANRGLCAQACRLPYELHSDNLKDPLPTEGEFLLSPQDLCTIDMLDKLCTAGIASLKIEGRMKSADYVHEVVSVYREALNDLSKDASVFKNHESLSTQKRRRVRLSEAFSRGFTTAYLEGQRGNEIMSYKRPNNRGVFAGRVTFVGNDFADIAFEIELHHDDVIEIWTNRGHFAVTVPHNTVLSSNTIRIPINQHVSKGDRVFRVRNTATAFVSSPFEPRIPISGYAILERGKPAHIHFETSTGATGDAWGEVVETARTKALTEEDVRAHINRLGQTPFSLCDFNITLDSEVGMSFSQLHHLRSDALEVLTAKTLESWHEHQLQQRQKPSVSLQHCASLCHRPSPGMKCLVMAWVTNPSCARAAKRAGADELYVPVLNFRRGQSQMAGVRQEKTEQAGYPKQCTMALPAVNHDLIPDTREDRLSFDFWEYIRPEKPVFADSLAGAIRALHRGSLVEIGPHVPLVNKASLQFAADLGIKRVWLSPELTLGQIAELANDSPVELGIFVCGAQELMICEHCLLMSQGSCTENCESCPRRSIAHWLVDRKGFNFPVVTDVMGRCHIYNGIELDAVSALCDLSEIGISAVMVDTTLMNAKTAEAAVKRVLNATQLASAKRRPGTTTGHLFRGVS